MKPTTLFTLCCLLLFSCKGNRFEVPGSPEHPIKLVRFDQQFHTNDPSLDSAFLKLYAVNIMEMGEPGGEDFKAFSDIYHHDPDLANLYDSCQQIFSDTRALETSLTWAFYRLTYYFPYLDIPTVYMHISGYGQSIVSAPGMLSASLDKYLGANHPMYQLLYEPHQASRMIPEKLLSDYLLGWIQSEFTPSEVMNQNRLLDYLLYEGKIIFLTSFVLPDEPLERLFSFTPEQLEWCRQNEKSMWDGIVQHKLLFSNDKEILNRFLGEAPSTIYFPSASPGRAATWIGYRIIEEYMEKHPKTSLQELMTIKDAQLLLNGSNYHP